MKRSKVEAYSLEMLLNDIQDKHAEESIDKEKRDYKAKLIIIQALIQLAASYNTDNKNDKKLSNALEVKVGGDEWLHGYIFFVSHNPQFEYTWSNMRKRRNDYIKFLVESVRFLNSVIDDINSFAGKTSIKENIHIVINDFLDIILIDEKPYVKSQILWENFQHIESMKPRFK